MKWSGNKTTLTHWMLFGSVLTAPYSCGHDAMAAGTHTEPIVVYQRMGADSISNIFPSYKVQVYSDGTVNYDGGNNTKKSGHQEYRISPSQIKDIVEAFQRAGFMEMQFAGMQSISRSSIRVSFNDGNRNKIIEVAGGWPKELYPLTWRLEEILYLPALVCPMYAQMRDGRSVEVCEARRESEERAYRERY